ncbi:NlpC/P60 family protein [Nannocystaceae bacterium ST9]
MSHRVGRSRPSPTWIALLGSILACMACMACMSPSEPAPRERVHEDAAPTCPSASIPETRAPDVEPEMEHAEFWLAKLGAGQADAVLIGPGEREAIAARIAATPGSRRDPIDPALAEPAHVDAELGERLEWLRGRVASGKYVEGEVGALEQAADVIARASAVDEADALHTILRETPLWCVPTQAGLYTTPIDRDFDRNQCASLHLGELVRVIRRAEGWAYLDTGHSVGWIALTEPAPLGPARNASDVAAARSGEHWWVLDDWSVPELVGVTLRAGTRFAREADTLRLPTAGGETSLTIGSEAPLATAPLPFTRRAVFERTFAQLGDPYGWGGRAGHRDCSSLLLDVFAQFDLSLGRNSAVQSQLGVHTIELAGQSDQAKRAAIRAAAERGVVLLYMPGHIMLYLGHHTSGGVDHDYGLSAISDYLVPCPGGSDTVHRLDRVAVTTLELGRGSERKAYLERIERLAVFAPVAP